MKVEVLSRLFTPNQSKTIVPEAAEDKSLWAPVDTALAELVNVAYDAPVSHANLAECPP